MSEEPPIPDAIAAPAQSRGALRNLAVIVFIAFLLGLAAMALALRYRPALLQTAQPVAPAEQPRTAAPLATIPGANVVPGPAIDLNGLAGREAALAAHIADLEARTARVSEDAQAAAGNAGRAEDLLAAFAARRAIDRGLALGYVEEQLRTRFGDAQPRAVATILQAAREPVTLEDLRGGLDGVAAELTTGAASSGWLASLRRELGNLVVLHKAGTPSPLPADRLARVRRMLDAGQVEAALAEVARMPGAARATGWTSAARRYVDARQALDLLENAALVGRPAANGPVTITP